MSPKLVDNTGDFIDMAVRIPASLGIPKPSSLDEPSKKFKRCTVSSITEWVH